MSTQTILRNGDRVFALLNIDGKIPSGKKGTIYKDSIQTAYVRWDNFSDGHSGSDGRNPEGSCWNVPIKYVKILQGDWDE